MVCHSGRKRVIRVGVAIRNAVLALIFFQSAAPLAAGPVDVALELQPVCSDLHLSMDDRLAKLTASGWAQLETGDTAQLVNQISWARVVEMRAGQTIAEGTEDETYSLVQTLTRRALVSDPKGRREFGVFLRHESETGLSLYLAKIEAQPFFQHYCSLIIDPSDAARNEIVNLFVLTPAISVASGQVWRIMSSIPNPDARVVYSRLLTIPNAEGAATNPTAAILRYQLELQVSR